MPFVGQPYHKNTLSSSSSSENLTTWDFRGLFLPENDFKTCTTVNCRKWLENWNLKSFKFFFFVWSAYSTKMTFDRETLPGVLLKERKFNISK